EFQAVLSLEPGYLLLDAFGPLTRIGVYVGAEGGVCGVVASSLAWLHGRGRARDLDGLCPSFGNLIDVVGVFDQKPLVEAERQVIEQVRPEDVIVVEAVVADVLRGVPASRRHPGNRPDVGGGRRVVAAPEEAHTV